MSVPAPNSRPNSYAACLDFIRRNNSALETIAATIKMSSNYPGLMSGYRIILTEQSDTQTLAIRPIVDGFIKKSNSEPLDTLCANRPKLVRLMRKYKENQTSDNLEAIIGYLFDMSNPEIYKESLLRNKNLVSSVSEKALKEISDYLCKVKRNGLYRFLPRLIARRSQKTSKALKSHTRVIYEVMTSSQSRRAKSVPNTIPCRIDLTNNDFVSYLLKEQPHLLGSLINTTENWIGKVMKPASKLAYPVFENYVRDIVNELENASALANTLLQYHGVQVRARRRRPSEISVHGSELMKKQPLKIGPTQIANDSLSKDRVEFVSNYLVSLQRISLLIRAAGGFKESLRNPQIIVWSKITAFSGLIEQYRGRLFEILEGTRPRLSRLSNTSNSLWHPHEEMIQMTTDAIAAFDRQHDAKSPLTIRPVLVVGPDSTFNLFRLAGSYELCVFTTYTDGDLLKSSTKIATTTLKAFTDTKEISTATKKHPNRLACFIAQSNLDLPPRLIVNKALFVSYDMRCGTYWSHLFKEDARLAIKEITGTPRWEGTLSQGNHTINTWITHLKDMRSGLPKIDLELSAPPKRIPITVKHYMATLQSIIDRIDLMDLAFSPPPKSVQGYLKDLRFVRTKLGNYLADVLLTFQSPPKTLSRDRRRITT